MREPVTAPGRATASTGHVQAPADAACMLSLQAELLPEWSKAQFRRGSALFGAGAAPDAPAPTVSPAQFSTEDPHMCLQVLSSLRCAVYAARRRCKRRSPPHSPGNHRSTEQAGLRRFDEALSAFDSGLSTDPGNEALLQGRAMVVDTLRQLEAAAHPESRRACGGWPTPRRP